MCCRAFSSPTTTLCVYNQAKPYVSRLTGVHRIDREIMKSVRHDFEEWLRRLDPRPDSDVSDHEGKLQTLTPAECVNLDVIVATFDVEN